VQYLCEMDLLIIVGSVLLTTLHVHDIASVKSVASVRTLFLFQMLLSKAQAMSTTILPRTRPSTMYPLIFSHASW
jgi:hypothetical protein